MILLITDSRKFYKKGRDEVITKVTSANYDDYTLLFNQADAALKEYNGEPTSEFVKIDWEADPAPVFDSKIQYFDSGFSPLQNFDANAFSEAEIAGTELYVLNEQIIYDLDTYFGRLKLLSEIDYSFLRLPLDEPTFDIMDDAVNGRRVIKVPEDFNRNGISVQGDETAEILFFSVDRYYDSTDLWTADMNFVIQWKTATKNGVTRAFLNKDSRPFIDDNGKLFFGWPISSEITDEPGDVVFSVRIFKFSDNVEADGTPKLAFGLNTQTAKVTVNPSLAFEFEDENNFKDAETISKTSDLVSRIINSTVLSESEQEAAPTPTIISNILTDEVLASRISEKIIARDVYVLATGAFDESATYYNADHEVVSGLNEYIYRAGIYYTKQTANQTFYEFDADIIDKIQQIQAVVPSGIITYTAHAQASPNDTSLGGSSEFVTGDSVVYIPVESTTREQYHKYYEFDDNSQKYIVALNIATEIGAEWDDLDKKMNVSGTPCKYFERISPKLVVNEDNPVGCYWIVANNNESKKALSSTESYRIWIPGPVDLTEDDVTKSADIDDNDCERVLINSDNKANLSVTVTAAANNNVKYDWSGELADNVDAQELTYTPEELALVDENYTVECYTTRNKKDSPVKIQRKFRVTAPAQKFVFDTVADSDDETAHPTDNVKVLVKTYNEENAYEFKVDFSENIVDGALDKVSDKIAYRFRQRQGQDVGSANIFINDIAPSNWSEGLHFKLGTYEELKDVVFTIPKDNEYYYVEVINIVNEDFSLDELNDAADAVAASSLSTAWLDWEPRISRTPYVLVRA